MTDSNHLLIKTPRLLELLGGISRPHLNKRIETDPRFPQPVWMHGTRFFWLDQALKYIDACAADPPPPKNKNLRTKQKRAA